MGSLDDLILQIQNGMKHRQSFTKFIKNPQMLIKSLKELRNMIGYNKVKDSVADQIVYLIMHQRRKLQDSFVKTPEVMLNTVLSSGPGTGKSHCGVILAKIWHSLGYLKSTKSTYSPIKRLLPDSVKDTNEEWFSIFFIVLLIWMFGLIWNFYGSYGGLLTFILIFLAFLVIGAIIYSTTVAPAQSRSGTLCADKAVDRYTDDDIIRIVS